ncbi:hypothetical protein PGH26_08975 [Sporosarcina jeotgali]|uniref:DUF1129 domain-containing protein n=1 Tax=Sporosarcina jeotgali TaxID=3020056 RepID=A0ABZ0KSY3_9BACL|nr:hypothetical protein [Sporosarcina sp. B2O-1]WOV83069.1 hypothetical protein PGH26_08975 [Sporosarcina sp. B2O-1]
MSSEFALSRKSKKFLEDLRVYLITSKKSLDDVNDIVNDLEDHLYEAEQNGKTIEKIVGSSPKEYMEMVSGELTTDNKSWFKYICLIIFGSFTFMLFPDILTLDLSYSVLDIVSHIVISSMFLLFAFAYLKCTIIKKYMPVKRAILFLGLVILISAISFGIVYLNQNISSPIINFGTLGSIIIAVIMTVFLAGLVFWAAK